MPSTMSKRPASSRHSHLPPFDKAPAAFARSAVYEEFRSRDARAIDQDGFEDRRPTPGPRALGRVAAKVTNNTGVHALRHWLNQAGRADSDEKREVALEIAGEIARLLGLDTDLIGPRAV